MMKIKINETVMKLIWFESNFNRLFLISINLIEYINNFLLMKLTDVF